jgi:hypothetical protein
MQLAKHISVREKREVCGHKLNSSYPGLCVCMSQVSALYNITETKMLLRHGHIQVIIHNTRARTHTVL